MKKFSAVLVSLLFASAQAYAYIPPSQFMVRQMVAKKNSLKNLWLRSFVVGYEGEKPSVANRFRVTMLYDEASHILQSWASNENDQKLYWIERNAKTLTPVDLLLLDDRPEEVVRVLKSRRIPIKTDSELLDLRDEAARRAAEETTLMRWRSSFSWVIGPPNGISLWLEKDTFLPVRFVFTRPLDNEDVDVQFESYRFVKDFAVPRAMTVSKKGNFPIFREELNDVQTNQTDLKLEKKISPGFTDIGNQLPQAMKDLIQQYYLTYR